MILFTQNPVKRRIGAKETNNNPQANKTILGKNILPETSGNDRTKKAKTHQSRH